MIEPTADTAALAACSAWGPDGARIVERPAAFAGAAPLAVLEPDNARTAAAMLRWADDQRFAVVPIGGGTKIGWGAGWSRADLLLSTALLQTPFEHCAGDLTATLPAGAALRGVNARLAEAGQWLPLDPPFSDRATIGGIVAAHDSGPRRLRYGSPRDLIIGIEMATVDGRVSKAGGRVVKNVAGYDLARLMCGSFGSLAVITSATFKLAPVPPASRTVVATTLDVRSAAALALALADAPLTPSALEIESPPPRLLVRFETTAAAADRQAAAARALCAEHGATADVLTDAAERSLWSRAEARLWDGAGAVLKISVLPTEVSGLCGRIDRAAAEAGAAFVVSGRAALGVVLCRLDGATAAMAATAAAVRGSIPKARGSMMVLSGPPALKDEVGWGEMGDAFPLMQAVKAEFDPRRTLTPGRGPGGL